jgi:hypothetical protein
MVRIASKSRAFRQAWELRRDDFPRSFAAIFGENFETYGDDDPIADLSH